MTLLHEGVKESKARWQQILGITGDDGQFQGLVDKGILEKQDSTRTEYRLALVGLLFTRNNAFIAAPKIFDTAASIKPSSLIHDIVACLRTYFRKQRDLTQVSASEVLSWKKDRGRVVETFLQLLDWTLTHGFQMEKIERADDAFEDIDWPATMDVGTPLHIGESVIYSEIVSRGARTRLGPLALLQAQTLLRLHRTLSPVSSIWLSDNSDILDEARQIVALADESELLRMPSEVADYLSSCNLDTDRDIATILLNDLTDKHAPSQEAGAFGVTDFHWVWEDMCRQALSSERVLKHGEIASQPHYEIGEKKKSAAPQRPDILSGDDLNVHIYDAKWYAAERDNLPGVDDIIKQIVYELSVEQSLNVAHNAFLLPTRSLKDPTNIGNVFMVLPTGAADKRFPSVSVVGIPWDIAVATYCGFGQHGAIRDALLAMPSR